MHYVHSFIRWSKRPLGLTMLGGGAVTLSITYWLLFGGTIGGTIAPPKKEDLRFMHCTSCGMETMYNPDLSICIQCKKGRYLPTKDRIADIDGNTVSPTSKWTIFGFVAFIVAQAVFLLWLQHERRGPDPEEQEIFKCRCPSCKRKYAYTANSAGTTTRCRQCKTEFELPTEV